MTKRVSWGLATLTAITATMVVSSATYASGDAYISAATSCFASASTPWYRSPSVHATGHIYCATVTDIEIDVVLTRDGAEVDSAETAAAAPQLSATAIANNQSGNQKWCTLVTGRYYSGGNTYPLHDSACESAAW